MIKVQVFGYGKLIEAYINPEWIVSIYPTDREARHIAAGIDNLCSVVFRGTEAKEIICMSAQALAREVHFQLRGPDGLAKL